jgi:uncharacterized protein YecE (DUF72 family)
MGEILIGAGGWDYFAIPNGDRLRAYSSAFNFVEVNSTYYRLPSPSAVASWRVRVPPRFEFSVRCHKDLAELHRLELTQKAIRIIDSMEKTCRRLKANVLTILVPKRLVEDRELPSKLNTFLSTINLHETRIAIEFRGVEPTEDALEILRDHDATQSVDPSTQDPKTDSSILYGRLFGKEEANVYEFDDSELEGIAKKASGLEFEQSILAFHGVRMYRDAARLKTFLSSGKFPSLTGQVGLESLGQVLNEDARFPSTKSQLVANQGWKLYDRNAEERARVGEVLDKLPERIYSNIGDVLTSVKRIVL